MSAIAGIFHFNNEPIPIENSNRIMESLKQYPANDMQTWQKDHIFLGCHAQWITPESIGEQVPYYDYERRLVITADAIIDNRVELFNKLQIEKTDRTSMSDCQLILLAYGKWGDEVVKYLQGDFAFVIWDEEKNKLFGARDFSGSRTLYYFQNKQQFVFCTTIKPLFTLPYIKKELNEEWLAEYIAIPDMFNTVDLFSTVYKNINQVPPSHYITIMNGKVKLTRYSVIDFHNQLKLNSNQEYEEAFRDVFGRAVKARLRTHHNVGAHLSGGMDSGSVVSFAAKELQKENKTLHTFSYVPLDGFKDWTPKSRMADERPYIQSTVKHVGNIKDYYFDFKGKSPLTEVNEWLDILEMPYKFFLNSYWLKGIYEQAEQNKIGLLLNGARGNYTISWGSALDYYAKLLKKLHLIHLHKELLHYIQYKQTGRKSVLLNISKKAFPFINRILPAKRVYNFPVYINRNFAKRTKVFEKLQQHKIDQTGASIPDKYEARNRQFQQLFIWGNGISGTKLSLRHSLWTRDPTNDLEVIRFCLSLPDSQYIQNGMDRSLIRRATEQYLPNKVRLNHQVRGVQGADGIQRIESSWNQLIEEIEEMSFNTVISEFLDVKVIQNAISKVKDDPKSEYIFLPEFTILIRSLIVYRFLKNSFERR